jgi:hypothetical protein
MEALSRAVLGGEQSLSWSEFQAASMEAYDGGGGGGGVNQVGEENAFGVKADVPSEGGTVKETGTGVKADEGSTAETGTCVKVDVTSEGGTVTETGPGVKVELENRELWAQFDEITNEMIITKAGRYEHHATALDS